MRWLDQEGCIKYLSQSERDFIENDLGDPHYYQTQVEGLNVFAWVLQFVNSMSFESACSKTLISYFPDIKNGKSSSEFRNESLVRPLDEVISICDLSYCLHWAIVNSRISSDALPQLGSHVVIERRRALEWMLSTVDWDEVNLDT